MLNLITIEGHLGRDPHIEMTQDGRQIARFSIATSSKWKDKTGEWHTHTDWHKIVVYRESTIRWLKGVLKRGTQVRVKGALTYGYWYDKYRQRRRTASIRVADLQESVELMFPEDSGKESLVSEKTTPPSEVREISQPLDEEEKSFDIPHDYFQQLQQQTGEKEDEKQ